MSRRGALVYATGLVAYLVAITQRTTIGVAGVSATERFHANAAILSMLAVLQLVVYAGAQIPFGVLLDRLGPRRMMIGGLSVMAIGQIVVALSPNVVDAIVGRVLVGAGDATIFLSVIRLVSSWFPGPRVPIAVQWLSNAGQLGQVLSAVPFAALLHEQGWTPAFLAAAGFVVLGIVLVIVLVVDRPADAQEGPRPESWTQSLRQLGESLRRPGTQLGFWSHFVTMSPMTMFTLMWGLPYLVFGLGYPRSQASVLLIVPVIAGMIVGPVLGVLTGRHPLRRSNIVLFVVAAMALIWAVMLLWPGKPPFAVVVTMLVIVGIGGPGSAIGFDFARTSNPLHALGSANGVVNVGGFSASFVMIYVVGSLLDLANSHFGQPLYSLASFRVAFLVVFVILAVGLVGVVRARRRTRARMLDEEGIRVAPIWVAFNDAWARRKAARG
ncbi:MFS transporter [Gryllotalpicola koreensis]|uniref:MFS transporter n=1 Tax=Gryllotalpicola koreensis TaxID=993086 RepID=A0ABP7ZWV5_9MICO